ncbi:hypothetical protein MUK42_24422 [Musa troglodytarum]|uniref:Uncharacterized protein n=2 Tax=Musa troglodytarum TaxID=320322 RepID=A0A9E7L9G6_9LILI|nr:hypothetical protein MUK42_24422 [Musa troglodytarum]
MLLKPETPPQFCCRPTSRVQMPVPVLQSSLLHPSFPLRPPRAPFLLASPCALVPRPLRLHLLRRHRIAALAGTDEELLRAITAPSGPDARLPAIRSYDADLASLTLIGAVGSEQAVTAAAADGGVAAEEHLSSGASTMVLETVFPGGADERSTVSTRLVRLNYPDLGLFCYMFLPAKRVVEKAKKLRSSLTADILSANSNVTKNILAMTFRQVILQKVWSFKLSLFCPGTERKMEDLASPRETPADFTASSSDVKFLSALAEAVCSCILEGTERRHFGESDGSRLSYMFGWLHKPQGNCSADSSICVYKIAECEIVRNAMSQVDKFNLSNGKASYGQRKMQHPWWMAPNYIRLEKAGGPGLSSWTNEFVPAYRLQINTNTFKDAKLEGGHKMAENRCMRFNRLLVELANVLDMYYEDKYTLPDKQLFCSLITESSTISMKKSSPLKMLFATLAGACIFVVISVLAQVCWPHIKVKTSTETNNLISSREIDGFHFQSHGTAEIEGLCISVVERIKDALGWPGEVPFDADVGAWIGAVPSYLRNKDPSLRAVHVDEEHVKNLYNGDIQSQTEQSNSMVSPISDHVEHPNAEESSSVESLSGMNHADFHTTAQDIASFQVVLSGDGKIIGFQPTNRVAVNQWASNPLAKLLYGGRRLSPGLLEPSLKIPLPHEVVLLELLMSVNPESSFALARPIR